MAVESQVGTWTDAAEMFAQRTLPAVCFGTHGDGFEAAAYRKSSTLNRYSSYMKSAGPLRVVDFNNMYTSTGGGIRTYHERKLAVLGARDDVEYTLIVPSDRNGWEEVQGSHLCHIQAWAVPFTAGYRHKIGPSGLGALLHALRPDVIEVGGCYVDPLLIRRAAEGLGATILGFWHTDYPSAYFRYYGAKLSATVGDVLERIGWWYARRTFGSLDGVIAASGCVVDNLINHGIHRVLQCPLGVDTRLFHPRRRSAELRASYGAGERTLIFFPHRLIREKGVFELVQAIPGILHRTDAVIVFAGDGPGRPLVENLVRNHTDFYYAGYLHGREEMARHLASADLVLALSPYETFGLSIVEAMASGVPLLGPENGAGREWIIGADCGATVRQGDPRALGEAVVGLTRNPDRVEMGRRGRHFAETYLTWDHVFDRLVALYRRLIDHKRGVRRRISDWPVRWVRDVGDGGV